MGKTTDRNDANTKVKRRLLNELNNSVNSDATKRMRLTDRSADQQNLLPSTSNGGRSKFISNKGGIVAEFTAKNGKRTIASGNSVKAIEIPKPPFENKTKIQVHKGETIKQTRSRIVKPPARFLDDNHINFEHERVVKPVKLAKKPLTKKKVEPGNKINSKYKKVNGNMGHKDRYDTKNFADELTAIDTLTNAEIVDGNAAIDHDGVELSVQGSDLDDFSDEEAELDRTEGNDGNPLQLSGGEPGEIFSGSDDEEVTNTLVPVPVTQPMKGKTIHGKFSHLQNDPDFNKFLDGILDQKLSNKDRSGTRTMTATATATKESIRIDGKTARTKEGSGFKDSRQVVRTSGNSAKIPRIQVAVAASPGGRDFHDATQNEENDTLAEKATDQLLLQAEKFKARVEAPKGMYNVMPYDYDRLRSKFVTDNGLGPIDSEIMILRNFDQDDEFFHVTSQIEPNLKSRIERGEYIDLERLLPKDRFSNNRSSDDLNKQLFQLITQGTNTYMSPPDPRGSNRINNIKKWDQAFRVFAAIYTQANPQRSSEIWQYIYVIHTAAAANSWESVACYDQIFRQLMASKPWRNWGKTYNQGWNMAFSNNHNVSQYNHGGGSSNTQHYHRNNQNPTNGTKSNSWKDDCCWRFNKNKCSKTANECRYHHRCTHCAGWYHSYNNCRKRGNRGNAAKSGSWNNYNSKTLQEKQLLAPAVAQVPQVLTMTNLSHHKSL